MNVQEFQNKLKEVQEIARQHGNALNAPKSVRYLKSVTWTKASCWVY